MKISVSSQLPLQHATPCLILPLWQDQPLSPAAAEIDAALGGVIQAAIQEDGFVATPGATQVLHAPADFPASRVLLLGTGKLGGSNLTRIRKAFSKAARTARSRRKAQFAVALPEGSSHSVAELAMAAVEGITLGLHVFNDFKTQGEKPLAIEEVTLLVPAADVEAAQSAVDYAQLVCTGNLLTRRLVNLPSNLKFPDLLAQEARRIAEENGLRCEVWDEHKIREERMGALWGVGMGSSCPPRFIVLEYVPEGTEDTAPIALVGKGMTYDTGGYSLKPTTSMEDMKDDMAGAGVVLGVMSLVRQLGLKRRVLGVIASAENMVSGHSQRPGDIVTARNGKTIEVLNTDAEGRLILADALTWTSEQNPELIIDFATLTGAIGITLGQEGAGLFATDDELAAALAQSGDYTGERLWRLPLWEEYLDYVKGTVSDLKNIGPERRAGSIVATAFMHHFVGEGIPWAHLDIAAVSLVRDDRLLTARGATGFGVRLIADFLRRRS